jgi:hypothetical protein
MGKMSFPLTRNIIVSIQVTILLLCLYPFDYCLAQSVIPYEAGFLLEPPDARGRSLAGGGSVYSNGAVSAYYNPAGLVSSGEFSAEINYTTILPSLADDFSLTGAHLSKSVGNDAYFGFGYVHLNYGSRVRTDEGGRVIGSTTLYDYSLALSGAYSFNRANSIGLGVKYIFVKHDISFEPGLDSGSSVALDFGFLSRGHFPRATVRIDEPYYPTLRKYCRTERIPGITLGASFTNIGPDVSFDNDYYNAPPPRNLRLALGYQILDADYLGLRFTVDALKLLVDNDDHLGTEIEEIKWIFGFEATFLYIINLRAGRYLDDVGQQRYTSVGFGLGPQWLRFDYSRVLESDEQYNRRSEESSYSLYCNIFPYIFSR